MKQPKKDKIEGRPRRFDVELLIVHPTMDPAEITAALRMQPVAVQRVGDRRKQAQGDGSPAYHKDTRWRYGVRHTTRNQWFVESIADFVTRLTPHKAFLHELRATGGTTCLMIQFLDREYYGDQMKLETLAEIVGLGLDFGLENYAVPQSQAEKRPGHL